MPVKLFSTRKKSRSRHAAQNAGNRSLPFFIMFSGSTRNPSVLIGNKSQEAVVKLVKRFLTDKRYSSEKKQIRVCLSGYKGFQNLR